MIDLINTIIPRPVHIKENKKAIRIGSISSPMFRFEHTGKGVVFNEAVRYLLKTFEEKTSVVAPCGKYLITLKIDASDSNFTTCKDKKEAYYIDITDKNATLCGIDEAVAYYAAVSFTQLIFTEDSEIFLPGGYILDYPSFEKRGHYLECRYGSDFMTLEDWENALDYLSAMKINTIMVGLYGCWSRQYDGEFAEYLYIPIKKYPKLQTPRNIKYYSVDQRKWVYKKNVLPTMFEGDFFSEIIAYGKKKNIEVIAFFNSLGHNTLLPRVFPEISAVDEHGEYSKTGFCTNNEKTYEIMFDIYDEIIERYLKPNGIYSFEIGLDEIWKVVGVNKDDLQKETSPFCKCEKCRDKEQGDILVEYLIRIAKHLKQKGIKNIYIYHDMLFSYNLLNKQFADRLKREGVYDVIIIDWWSYARKEKLFEGRANEVNNLFRSIIKPFTGYYHWNMPTHANENIYSCAEIAKHLDFEGIVAYSSFEYCYDYNYKLFAECAWNTETLDDNKGFHARYSLSAFPEDCTNASEELNTALSFMEGRYTKINHCEAFFEYYTVAIYSKTQNTRRTTRQSNFAVCAMTKKNICPILGTLSTKHPRYIIILIVLIHPIFVKYGS